MDFKQLRYFVTLAEQLHFARAAEILDLSPSALTMQLQGLERDLGVKLVQRTKRSVALTQAGQLFLLDARLLLEQAQRARSVAIRAGRGELGRLEVAFVISAACAGIVQLLLSKYRAAHPTVLVSLSELESPEQIKLLTDGKLDACVVRSVRGDPAIFDSVCLLIEPIGIALHRDHRLASRQSLSAADLIKERFIVPQYRQGHGFAHHLLAIGNAAGFEPDVAFPTRDFVTALTLVGSAFGIAAVPHSVQQLPLPDIVFRPLNDCEETSELNILFRRNDRSPTVTQLRRIADQLKVDPQEKPPHADD